MLYLFFAFRSVPLLVLFMASARSAMAFQIPHPNHHHTVYVRYRQEQLERQLLQGTKARAPSCNTEDRTAAKPSFVVAEALVATPITYQEEQETATSVTTVVPVVDTALSTPVSYDKETGMVQTAVRAILQHPVATLVDNNVVGLSSTLVISLGAIHELVDCIELEWAHHATSSTEGLIILSIGHFLHYGRETIRQLVELHEEKDNPPMKSEKDKVLP